mmetsp:Transcript_25941/g.78919  ORF Transcript_25941/g.78919 Transcript_25941/m.78919 type:complete len:240 (+) Transcript_25941:276-995(+)|eukprot:scaffold64758_cov31-Tisochrysis_lutea.AAC.5
MLLIERRTFSGVGIPRDVDGNGTCSSLAAASCWSRSKFLLRNSLLSSRSSAISSRASSSSAPRAFRLSTIMVLRISFTANTAWPAARSLLIPILPRASLVGEACVLNGGGRDSGTLSESKTSAALIAGVDAVEEPTWDSWMCDRVPFPKTLEGATRRGGDKPLVMLLELKDLENRSIEGRRAINSGLCLNFSIFCCRSSSHSLARRHTKMKTAVVMTSPAITKTFKRKKAIGDPELVKG